MTDDESLRILPGPEGARGSAAWCVPTSQLMDEPEVRQQIAFPAVTAQRGGINWGAVTPKPEPEPQPDPPADAGPGHWVYGYRDDDGHIVSSGSSWHHEPFFTAAEARKASLDGDGAKIVRAWREELTWEDHAAKNLTDVDTRKDIS